jgi:hypothetical protein
MPTVAIVEGVRIMFFFADHQPPHFHTQFAEYQAQIAIESLDILEGNLPAAKLRAVREWAATRKPALLDAWKDVIARRNPGRIS